MLKTILTKLGLGVIPKPEFKIEDCTKRTCNCSNPDCRLEEWYPVKWDRGNVLISKRCKTVHPASKVLGVRKAFILFRAD